VTPAVFQSARRPSVWSSVASADQFRIAFQAFRGAIASRGSPYTCFGDVIARQFAQPAGERAAALGQILQDQPIVSRRRTRG